MRQTNIIIFLPIPFLLLLSVVIIICGLDIVDNEEKLRRGHNGKLQGTGNVQIRFVYCRLHKTNQCN